jgi:MFS family permease
MFSRLMVFACALTLLPAAAAAQAAVAATPVKPAALVRAASTIDESLPARTENSSLKPPRRKDSLWNGTLMGAGVGAVFGALIGSTLLDCSECSGFNVPLTFGVLGAGVGAGIGAGIDALHQRGPTVAAPPRGRRRVTVSPVLGKSVHAVVASIRF